MRLPDIDCGVKIMSTFSRGLKNCVFGLAVLSFLSVQSSFAGQLTVLTPWDTKFYPHEEQRSFPVTLEPVEDVVEEPVSPLSASVSEIKELDKYDVVLVVDRSSSMQVRDCPSENKRISRWQWCGNQIKNLANETKTIIKNGIKVVLFATDVEEYSTTDENNISNLFDRRQPSGMTNATKALRRQLAQYFERREQDGEKVKPLLLAVITDGGLDAILRLRNVIVEATNKMERPDEIAITFLQVGNDARSANLQEKLNKKPSSALNQFNIVTVKDFQELKQKGLPRALAEATRSTVN